MEYRRIQEGDIEGIILYCKKNGIEYQGQKPFLGLIAIDEGNIKGIIFSHQALVIEPFISENPVVATKLFYMMSGAGTLLDTPFVLTPKDGKIKEKTLDTIGFRKINNLSVYIKK